MTDDVTSATAVRRVSQGDAEAFCSQCNWAYEAWITHRCLFDDNRNPEDNISLAQDFTVRLSIITQEYALLQISKLHDPWKQGRHVNLSIDYMVRFGDWGDNQERIKEISSRLTQLHDFIRPARDKILSHNDLDTVKRSLTLGGFSEGVDEQYFDALQELANEVHLRWTGRLYPFNDLAIADVREFLALLASARQRSRSRLPRS